MKKKILFCHHSGVYGGASASLVFLLEYLKKDYECTVLTPMGTVTDVLTKLNINFITIAGLPQLNNNYWGSYRGIRFLILIREIFYFIRFLFYLKNIKKIKPDIIHLNDFTLLPVGKIIKLYYPSAKVYCHIRSLQYQKKSLYNKIQQYLANKVVSKFIAIDKDVYRSIKNLLIKKKTIIIYNSYKNFSKKKFFLKDNFFHVGFVGNFTDSKGLKMILDAAKNLKNKKIKFLVVGPVKKKPLLYGNFLHFLSFRKNFSEQILKNSESSKNIYFVGFRENLSDFYNKIDVVAFPSYLNAAGRPVLEGAINGIPSIIALDKGVKNDLVKNNYNGLYCVKNDSDDFSKKIIKIFENRNLYKKLSNNCLISSEKKFNLGRNGKKFSKMLNHKL